MSKGYRNGAFALGLAVGGGVVLNLFLWLDYRTNYKVGANGGNGQESQNNQVGQYWDGLIGTFVSPSDTLAQWVMAFFTICATVVLIFTLRSANKTNSAAIKASNAALEANQIMREEQRPWLVIDRKRTPFRCCKRMYRSAAPENLALYVENKGRLPATSVVATFVNFSHDTMTALEVSHIIEDAAFEALDLRMPDSSSVYQGEAVPVSITALPPSKRVIGSGSEWSLMFVCFYRWDSEVKCIWSVRTTSTPPENVLKAQDNN